MFGVPLILAIWILGACYGVVQMNPRKLGFISLYNNLPEYEQHVQWHEKAL